MGLSCVAELPPVTGAPYSAIKETLIFPRGTILRMRVFRDSQGRTRVEESRLDIRPPTLRPVTPGSPEALKLSIVRITDPVLGIGYMYNLYDKVAVRAICSKEVVNTGPSPSAPSDGSQPKRESLGIQYIEGIRVEGRRLTFPPQAGALPGTFYSVSEQWISPELRLVVLSKRIDEKKGDVVTMRITEIDRSEPDPTLFQPPPDYAIAEQPQAATP